MVELGTLGGDESLPSAINERGQIVGWSRTAGDVVHAVLWEEGRTTDLGPGGADDITENGKIVGSTGGSVVLWERGRRVELSLEGGWDSPALNERGDIVGMRRGRDGAETTPASWPWDSTSHAVLSQDGHTANLPTLPGFDLSYASAINGRGEIAGVAMTANGDHHLVLWHRGQMRDLGIIARGRGADGEWTSVDVGGIHINERGQIAVATSELFDQGEPGAFLADHGKLRRLPAKLKSISGLNDRGQVIGTADPQGGGTKPAFVWQDGRLTELPGQGEVRLTAINGRGEIVGTVNGRPVLWKPRRRT
jgi:probable HAF family extracellular repeat protein